MVESPSEPGEPEAPSPISRLREDRLIDDRVALLEILRPESLLRRSS
jgi:hypothetical protein